jgi:hypothetical protein
MGENSPNLVTLNSRYVKNFDIMYVGVSRYLVRIRLTLLHSRPNFC